MLNSKLSVTKYFSKSFSTQIALLLLAMTFGLFAPLTSHAATLFEGYYRVLLGAEHVGYFVQRYESLPDKKQMKASYFIYINAGGETTTEGVTALADENFNPISYQYTALVKGQAKAIDATLSKGKLTGKLTEGGQVKPLKSDVPANGFLSVFLNYVILKNGLAVGKSYAFEALAEEDAKFYRGNATIKAEQKVAGIDAFSLNFNYKGTEFTSLMSTRGDALGTVQQNVRTELVRTREEAVGTLSFPEKTLKTLFGAVPDGKLNPLNSAGATSSNTMTTTSPTTTITTTPPVTATPVPSSVKPTIKSKDGATSGQ